MSEQKLQSKIAKHIESTYNGYVVVTIQVSKSGTADLICCISGRFCGFEVKLPGLEGTLKPLQKHHIDLVIAAGGFAGMVTSIEQVDQLIRSHIPSIFPQEEI
jgi:hypothetical protein